MHACFFGEIFSWVVMLIGHVGIESTKSARSPTSRPPAHPHPSRLSVHPKAPLALFIASAWGCGGFGEENSCTESQGCCVDS
eukprot:10663894-Karenia_brevis.AAC.1